MYKNILDCSQLILTKKEMEAQKCGHHNHVAAYTHKITYFIDEQEPFIEMSENEK